MVLSGVDAQQSFSNTYTFDAGGDLCLTGSITFDPAVSLSPVYITYTPPRKILDYPLTQDKTWTSQSLVESSKSPISLTTRRLPIVIRISRRLSLATDRSR